MDGWQYKTAEQFQRKLDRDYDYRFRFIASHRMLSGLWCDVDVIEILTGARRTVKLYF